MRAIIAAIPDRWLAERRASDASRWDEVWHGELHMPPMPNRMHQTVAKDLLVFAATHWEPATGGLVHHEVNLTAPEDEADWMSNYRIPDLVFLLPPRFGIDRGEYMAGAPDAVVEVFSRGDETYEKFPFYAGLGVPEVWVIDRDTRRTDVFRLTGEKYEPTPADADGWIASAVGIAFQWDGAKRVAVKCGSVIGGIPARPGAG